MRAAVLARATAVWLDADVDVLAERVRRRDVRPLLHGRDAGEVLTRLAAERRPIYAEAHLHVRTEAVPHIRALLSREGRGRGRVTLVPRIDDVQAVEITIPGGFQVTPRLAQALKIVPGVERVEEV